MGTAHLTREIPAERAVAAIIPRQEIINALQDPEASPELMLQVATASGDATSTMRSSGRAMSSSSSFGASTPTTWSSPSTPTSCSGHSTTSRRTGFASAR